MTATSLASDTWVILHLGGQSFGVRAAHVREMTTTRDKRINHLPGAPPAVAGALKLRDHVFPVVDLRVLLGMRSMESETAELIQILDDREQDHVDWLHALEASARGGGEFKLATDPHKCKFGKWYDALTADEANVLKLANEDRTLARIIHQFDGPHQRIHGIASVVLSAVAEGRQAEALETIEATRTTDLAAMIRLFTEARNMMRELRKPLVGVLQVGDCRVAGLVDAIDSVREIPEDTIDRSRVAELKQPFVLGFAKGAGNDAERLTTLLDLDVLLERFCP